jgi:glyoxylase-like metal-dependent hydrolase (beta-lactamase superfamily II)
MTATITALDCGWLSAKASVLTDGGNDEVVRLPIPAWLVQHPGGVVVFDVGLHPGLATGPDMLGWMAKIFTPDLAPGGTVGPRLAEQGVDPAGSHTVVLSHCHFDHVGGLLELPNSRVVVHDDEWAAALAGENGYDPTLYDLGHDIVRISGEHDLFGDGAVTCIPTPGHTCGHQSLRVRTDDGPVILTADACYFTRTLDDGVLPPFAHDHDQQRRSLELLRRERDAGATIIPGHDAGAITPLYPTRG